MRKYISGILVIAIMIGFFAASAAGTSAKADAQYDLDDPEQRLAYEMTFHGKSGIYCRQICEINPRFRQGRRNS